MLVINTIFNITVPLVNISIRFTYIKYQNLLLLEYLSRDNYYLQTLLSSKVLFVQHLTELNYV